MRPIQMVDLYGQYEKIKPEIDRAIQSVIDSTAFIKGPDTLSFQQELATYLGSRHVIGCGNGTDALQVALMALNLQPDDEVITTPFSFISTIEVIKLLKLVPVLVDINPDTFNIDENLVEQAISEKTKAIIPVHLFGQCSNMESIMKMARNHGIFVIEDTAQAMGTEYIFSDGTRKKAGTIGHIGCTSFFPSKSLGCFGDGGAIITDDEMLASKIASVVNHGMARKYYYDHVGVNSRLDSLQAAILRIKLKYIDAYNQARQTAAGFYDSTLEPYHQIKTPVTVSYSTHIYHQYTIQLFGPSRDGLIEYLKNQGIPAMVYYPLPFHLQNAYLDLSYPEGDFPVAEQMSKNVLSLPIHTEMDQEQLKYITGHVINYLKK